MMRIAVVLICSIWSLLLQAQDPHFSQFYNAQSTVNPALVGVFNGKYRVSINYRNQWGVVLGSNPFTTYNANLEARQQFNNGDYFAFNVKSLYDQVGSLQYSQTYFHGGLAYHKKLGGDRSARSHYLSFGSQVGAGQNAINWGRIWFGRQFDTSTQRIDRDLDSGETLITAQDGRTSFYLDINAGLLWYSVFSHNTSFYAGVSAHHLNSPNIGLVDNGSDGSILYRKWTGMIGGEVGLSESFSLLPAIIAHAQGPSFQGVMGTSCRFANFETDAMALRFGVFSRVANTIESIRFDSFIVAVGLEQSKWILGLSYDFSMNNLATFTQNRGAFELSFTYQDMQDNRRRGGTSINCPTF